MIILPGTPLFNESINILQQFQIKFEADDDYGFVALPGNCGLLQAVTLERAKEYLYDGEYEERLEEIKSEDNDIFR